MKSKVVLVLWYINLCSKLADSIPFHEDSAQNVGAQQASGLPSNVLENKNTHSQLENLVAVGHKFNPDNNYRREVGTIEQERAVNHQQRGDTRWHALSRANNFPAIPQDVNAPMRYQNLPIPYRSGNFRPEALHIPQVTHNQQNLKHLEEAPIQLPFLRQPVNIQLNQRPIATQPVAGQAVETKLNQLAFIKQPQEVQMPFIRQPVEIKSVELNPNQRYESPSNVDLSRQPLKQLHQQQHREQIVTNNFMPSKRPAQTSEKRLFRPAETFINRQLFTQNVHNKQMRPQENAGPPTGVNLQQIVTNNELKKAAAAKTKSRYIVIYPNGSVEYVDQLEPIAKKYPNYVMVNGNNAIADTNVPLGHLPQISNAKLPLNTAQYGTNAETQVPVNNNVQQHHEVQIQTQNDVQEIQTQNHVQDVPNPNNIEQMQIETHGVSQSPSKQQEDNIVQTETLYSPMTITEQESTPVVTPATEIVSLPSEFDVEEIPSDAVATGPEGPNNFVINRDDNKVTQIVNTSYTSTNSRSESKSETENSESGDIVLNNQNQSQTIQSSTLDSAQSKTINEKQKQTQTTTQSESCYDSKEEKDIIVHNETIYNLPEYQSHEQSESNFGGEDHSDSEQQQTQVAQEQTQTSTESQRLAQNAPSTQTKNESTTVSQTQTQSLSSSSSSKFEQSESAPSSEAAASEQSFSKTTETTNDTQDVQADTQTTGEGQDEETSSDSTSSSQSQSESQSQSNTQLNNASSDADERGRPYAWFSTQDPDFLEKLLGKDKVLGVIYFFMVPSDAPYYPD